MKIKTITSKYRNDFSADLECEHCGTVQHIDTGYNDNYYHTIVLPRLFCPACGKNSFGLGKQQPSKQSPYEN